jgi:hypothetical protein
VDLLASRDAAIASRAEVISTEETGFPLRIVSERRCAFPTGEGAEAREYVDMDGDPALWTPLGKTCGKLPLRKVENVVGTVAFSGGGGGEAGDCGRSGRETGLGSGMATWKSMNEVRTGK